MNRSYTVLPFLLISLIRCMENKVPAITPSAQISFIESIFAGGRFCIDIEDQLIQFKHFKKIKFYSYPISYIEKLMGTLDPFSITDSRSTNICPVFAQVPNRFKEMVLYRQQARWYEFNRVETDPEISMNRKKLQQALSTKNCKKILKNCQKTLWQKYKPLKDDEEIQAYLKYCEFEGISSKKFQNLKYFISFFECILSKGTFKINSDGNTVQFKHYKKDLNLEATLFTKKDGVHNLFAHDGDPNQFSKLEGFILKHATNKDNVTKIFALLNKHQKKIFIFAMRLNRYMSRHFFQNRTEIKKTIKSIPSNNCELLDGFNRFFSGQSNKLHSYTGKLMEKYRNLETLQKAFNEKNIDYLARGNFNIALDYIPFNEEFSNYEERIKNVIFEKNIPNDSK